MGGCVRIREVVVKGVVTQLLAMKKKKEKEKERMIVERRGMMDGCEIQIPNDTRWFFFFVVFVVVCNEGGEDEERACVSVVVFSS